MMRRLLPIAFLFSAALFLHGESIFRSNPMGQALEPIDRVRMDEFPYTVIETDIPSGRRSTLFHEGKEVKRWDYLRDREGRREERYYEKGVLIRVTVYQGLTPVQEEEYRDGVLLQSVEYRYASGLIVSTVYRDSQGTLLYTDSFERDSNGRLRRVTRSFKAGETHASSFRYSGSSLYEEWCDFGSYGVLLRYRNSLLTAEETWRRDRILESTEYRYADGIRVSSSYRNFETGSSVETEYDADSLPVHSLEMDREGRRVETFFRNAGGYLAEKTVRQPGSTERWWYIRTASGNLVSEEYWKNGVLVKITEYRTEGDYTETYYKRGMPFLRIFYTDGTAVGEEPVMPDSRELSR